METTFGVQTRYDDIDLGLTDTFQRSFLSNVRSDKVDEASVGIYVQNTVHWTDWLRTTVGWRGDYYCANGRFPVRCRQFRKGQCRDRQPQIHDGGRSVQQDRIFLRSRLRHAQQRCARRHHHRRAGRPGCKSDRDFLPLGASPLLVRTKGAEVGVRTKIIPGLDSSVSVFILDQASEIVFQGDAGDTSASRPSQRYGVEWTNKYQPYSWLTFDGDLALSHARFVGYDAEQADLYASLAGFPQAQIGNAPGNYIPNAPAIVASAGITIGEKTGWFETLRWRYLGEPAHRRQRVPLASHQHIQWPRGLPV